MAIDSRIIASETASMIAMALHGAGLVYATEPIVAPHLASGALRLVLADHAARGPGFCLYHPGRRQMPAGLRLLVDLIREVQPLGDWQHG